MKLTLIVGEKESTLTLKAQSDFEKQILRIVSTQTQIVAGVEIDYHGHPCNKIVLDAAVEIDFLNADPKPDPGVEPCPPMETFQKTHT